MKEKHH